MRLSQKCVFYKLKTYEVLVQSLKYIFTLDTYSWFALWIHRHLNWLVKNRNAFQENWRKSLIGARTQVYKEGCRIPRVIFPGRQQENLGQFYTNKGAILIGYFFGKTSSTTQPPLNKTNLILYADVGVLQKHYFSWWFEIFYFKSLHKMNKYNTTYVSAALYLTFCKVVFVVCLC